MRVSEVGCQGVAGCGVWMGPRLGEGVVAAGTPIDQQHPDWLYTQRCPVESQQKSEIWIFRQSF